MVIPTSLLTELSGARGAGHIDTGGIVACDERAPRWTSRRLRGPDGGVCEDARSGHVLACLRRMDSPLRAMRWAACTMRSRMASASVGSSSHWCQAFTGSWLVMRVE